MTNTVKVIVDIGVRSSFPFLHEAMVRENFTVYAKYQFRAGDDKNKESHRRTRKALVEKKKDFFNDWK